MMTAAGFSYARARLHSRLAARLAEPDWQQLESSLDFAHALELAGRGPAARMTRQLGRGSGVHAVEAALRQALQADIGEIAGWLPPRWRPVVEWVALLPALREKAFAAQDGVRPAWFPGDTEGWEDAAAAWRREWARRLCAAGATAGLSTALAPLPARYLGPEAGAGSPRLGRDALERHFLSAFRSGRDGPVAVFAFLALVLLDAERLRGILVSRAVFAGEA